MIWNIIEVLALIGSLAGWLVTWAKLDEQKKLTQQEREKRWQETSIALTVEKELEQLKKQCETINDIARYQFARGVDLHEKNAKMQDNLSALLCPRNNHVWKDGVCVKCGRSKNDD